MREGGESVGERSDVEVVARAHRVGARATLRVRRG